MITVTIQDFKPENPKTGDLAQWKGKGYVWVDGWRQVEKVVMYVGDDASPRYAAWFESLKELPVCELA